jgi:hypothetical protein
MSITDELRKYANGYETLVNHKLLAIADRIDAEHERQLEVLYRDMSDAEYVKLPKDADGEYIHIGDVMDGYGKTIEVVELRYGRSGWVLISRDGNGYADTFAFTHHAPTVEDVLREFAEGLGVPIADSYIAATAAKLQLRGGAERATSATGYRRSWQSEGCDSPTWRGAWAWEGRA